MMFSSGIGRYIRSILVCAPEKIGRFFAACNSDVQIAWLEENCPLAVPLKVRGEVYSLIEQFEIPWYVRECDVIWSPHYNILLLCKTSIIVTVHDLAHLALPEIFGFGFKRLYAKLMLGSCMQMAKDIIFISAFTRSEFTSRVGSPIGACVHVILNGVSNAIVAEEVVERRKFLFVGNVKPHKNLSRLAVAMSGEASKPKLRVVGRRDGFRTLQCGMDRFGDILEFTGEIDDEELEQEYRNARALIFPSIYEGFGLPPLEAMILGCPVICSNVASLPEVCGPEFDPVTRTGNVLYFCPYDVASISAAIRRFDALSPQEISAMTTNASVHAKGFSWNRTAEKTWNAIHARLTSQSLTEGLL